MYQIYSIINIIYNIVLIVSSILINEKNFVFALLQHKVKKKVTLDYTYSYILNPGNDERVIVESGL